MQLFDDLALFFGQLTAYASSAAVYCRSVPILGGALADFFMQANGIFRDIRTAFADLSDKWDELELTIGSFLTWDGIRDSISLTWGFLDDITGAIQEGARDLILDQFSEITDFWGNVAVGARDLILDQFSEITDFWGNVGVGIRDWFEVEFEDWAEDQAERVGNLAGRILDKIW